jgi:hypothetical protein
MGDCLCRHPYADHADRTRACERCLCAFYIPTVAEPRSARTAPSPADVSP